MADHDLQTLRLFAAVVEHRNIARAAKECRIAASAVSKRIADLEARAKVSLLYRLRDGVEPTTAGLALLQQIKSILETVSRMDAELSEFAAGVQGRIRIRANTSAVTQFLPEDLKTFADVYPDVRFDLREGTSKENVEMLRNGSCDVGIFNPNVDYAGVQIRVYRRDTLLAVVPKGHPLSGQGKIKLADTLAYDHVGLQEGSSLQAKIQEQAISQVSGVRLRVQVLSFDGIRRMVEAGMGIAILPEGAVTPYTSTLALEAVELEEPWATRSILIGFRDYGGLSLACRRFVDHLAPADVKHGSSGEPGSGIVIGDGWHH